MSNVAQLRDDEGDKLINYAQSVGEENLSPDLKWRLKNTLERRRRLETAPREGASTNALSAQRLEKIEQQLSYAKSMFDVAIPEVLTGLVHQAEQRCRADAKAIADELRTEVEQKSNAQYAGFEAACTQLRDEDRSEILAVLRAALGDAEDRIDAGLQTAMEAQWERTEIEIALTHDAAMNAIAERVYGRGQLTDDSDPKLAERAIAGLRQQMTAVEEEGARQAARVDQLSPLAGRLADLEGEHKKATRSLLIRCAANVIAARKERSRADELARKVERLEAELERLVSALIDRKVLD